VQDREAKQIMNETQAYMKQMDDKKRYQLKHYEKLRTERCLTH
jgi:hypothetical protein